MTDNRSIQKALEDILSSESLGLEKAVCALSEEEKKIVAELLVMRAEEEFATAAPLTPSATAHVRKSLLLACELAPFDVNIWFGRAAILGLLDDDNEEILQEAITCFEMVTRLDEKFFTAWSGWASLLTRLGLIKDDVHLFHQAHEFCAKAESVATPQDLDEDPEFYWNWGLLLFMIAKYSGEATELNQALKCFQKAKEYGNHSDHFYCDYAQVLAEFGLLVNREDLLLEAVELFEKHLPNDEEIKELDEHPLHFATCFMYLASAYSYFFTSHLTEAHFLKAQEAFIRVLQLKSDFHQAWLHLGCLFLLAFKRWQKIDLLKACVERLREAYQLESNDPYVISKFAEAMAHLGVYEEVVDHLKFAEYIIETGLSEHPDSIELITALAVLYVCFGRYFEETKYFAAAIEYAEKGLIDDPGHIPLLHTLAQAKFFLSQSLDDTKALKEALQLFQKVSQYEVGNLAHFWNEWGIALVHAADLTQDDAYLVEAEAKFEKAIILQDSVVPEWLFNYGCTLDFLGDLKEDEIYYERAIQALQLAVNADPEFISARTHLACAYMHLGEAMDDVAAFREACHHFQIVIEQDPENDFALGEWGLALMHLAELTHDETIKDTEGLLEQAESQFFKALSLGNTQACYHLACLYSYQGNIADALFYFEKAIEEDMLPPHSILKEDDWLENLRKTDYFQQFLQKAEKEDEEE